ncbi:MAG TPA: single-stranded DNA-binding protein [Candidatus Cloacimonadota bacterium]|mgnify:FL=1|nr:single-stranded DNA-binding protein [Candidatus Cloacimonadota bacterium]
MSKILKFPRMNTITLSARLTREPEIRYSNNNMMIARLGLAFDRVRKDEYGNFQNIANFMDAVAFGKTAEICSENLHKGSPVIIEGEISVNTFTDQNGNNRKNVEILVSKIHCLEREENQGNYTQNYDNYNATVATQQNEPDAFNSYNNQGNKTQEDVPF